MEPTNPRAGQGGRPRTFQDDDFFEATSDLLATRGFQSLTLESVARLLGCTGPAVSRRFGSKRGLVRAYLEWALGRMTSRFASVRQTHSSPIEALRALGVMAIDSHDAGIELRAGDQRANLATFWAFVRCDAEYRPLFERYLLTAEDEIEFLLVEAHTAGEVVPCDPKALARALTAAWAWTTLFWTGEDAAGSLFSRRGQIFDAIIGPYRRTH